MLTNNLRQSGSEHNNITERQFGFNGASHLHVYRAGSRVNDEEAMTTGGKSLNGENDPVARWLCNYVHWLLTTKFYNIYAYSILKIVQLHTIRQENENLKKPEHVLELFAHFRKTYGCF